jgi:SAM-dependent methyltransferase
VRVPDQVSNELLRILACPACGGSLGIDRDALRCESCSTSYRLDAGVPVMVGSNATYEAESDDGPLARLLHGLAAHPKVYDAIQRAVGYRRVAARIRKELARLDGTILDIGAGTGAVADLVPDSAEYIWLDYDRRKLAGFRSRRNPAATILADAQRLPLRDDSVDNAVTVDVSHHLDDQMFTRLLSEAARVTRDHFVFVDALRVDSAGNRLLWRYDAGARPRSLDTLRSSIEREFVIEHAETFKVVHHYVLYLARPIQRAPIADAGASQSG